MKHKEAQEFLNGCTKQVLVDAYREEYLEWKRTGVLPDGIIRDTYEILSGDGDEYVSIHYVDMMFNERLAELWYTNNSKNKRNEIEKLPKGNRIFVTDPEVLKFIEHCKKNYSDKIRNINLSLYDEEDAGENEWQLTVMETSDNNKQGYVWAAWHIPTN